MVNVRGLVLDAAHQLEGLSSTPTLDAEVLVAHALNLTREQLLLKPDITCSTAQADTVKSWLARRLKGEPIAYLTGHKEFFGRDFLVSPDVLIPRPDSETAVVATLEVIDSLGHPTAILELGTGSGAIGLTLALERPTVSLTLTDISEPALQIARQNALALGAKAEFKQQDLLDGETGRYDILVANLPYVPAHWLSTSDSHPDTRGLPYEPLVALIGGEDGLDLYRRLFDQLAAWPEAPQNLVIELGDEQIVDLTALVKEKLPSANVTAKQDLAGLNRALVIRG